MTIAFDNRMPQSLHVALCNSLGDALDSPADCNHRFTLTEKLLRDMNGGTDIAPQIEWLHEHGAYCDCEVLLNTIPDPE